MPKFWGYPLTISYFITIILFQIIGEGCRLFNLNGEEDYFGMREKNCQPTLKMQAASRRLGPLREVTRKFATALKPAALNGVS